MRYEATQFVQFDWSPRRKGGSLLISDQYLSASNSTIWMQEEKCLSCLNLYFNKVMVF